jgi:hypothetical protein
VQGGPSDGQWRWSVTDLRLSAAWPWTFGSFDDAKERLASASPRKEYRSFELRERRRSDGRSSLVAGHDTFADVFALEHAIGECLVGVGCLVLETLIHTAHGSVPAEFGILLTY